MLVTLPGIVMSVKLLQPKNAESPMLVTLFGMLMLVMLLHSLNADFPMLVTPSGIVTSPEQVVPSIKIPFTITSGFPCCLLTKLCQKTHRLQCL